MRGWSDKLRKLYKNNKNLAILKEKPAKIETLKILKIMKI